MTEVRKTKDYSIFKKCHSNRDIDQANLRRIIASLKLQNMLQFRPILCNSNMEILDGQHRFEAAKSLDLEVYYQINQDSHSEDIILLNANQKKWLKEDYLHYFISKGNIQYIKVKEYCDKHNVTLQEFLRMDSCYYAKTRSNDTFSSGTYKFPDDKGMEEIEMLTHSIKKVCDRLNSFLFQKANFTNNINFKKALIELIKTDGFVLDKFIERLGKKLESLHPCADVKGYFFMLKSIFNWNNRNPIEVE